MGMNTFADLIDALGGTTAFAEGIDIPASHARTMKARNSIPPEYWRATLRLAEEKGAAGVNAEALMRMRAAKAGSVPAGAAA